jgi:hypothetical protein
MENSNNFNASMRMTRIGLHTSVVDTRIRILLQNRNRASFTQTIVPVTLVSLQFNLSYQRNNILNLQLPNLDISVLHWILSCTKDGTLQIAGVWNKNESVNLCGINLMENKTKAEFIIMSRG